MGEDEVLLNSYLHSIKATADKQICSFHTLNQDKLKTIEVQDKCLNKTI
jgi:hypothetical protein